MVGLSADCEESESGLISREARNNSSWSFGPSTADCQVRSRGVCVLISAHSKAANSGTKPLSLICLTSDFDPENLCRQPSGARLPARAELRKAAKMVEENVTRFRLHYLLGTK